MHELAGKMRATYFKRKANSVGGGGCIKKKTRRKFTEIEVEMDLGINFFTLMDISYY